MCFYFPVQQSHASKPSCNRQRSLRPNGDQLFLQAAIKQSVTFNKNVIINDPKLDPWRNSIDIISRKQSKPDKLTPVTDIDTSSHMPVFRSLEEEKKLLERLPLSIR